MSYQSKTSFKSAVDASYTSGSNKWTGAEVETSFTNMADSVSWESQKFTATPFTYNCNNGNLQEMTLSGNGTLVISNAEAGKYYTLIKKGSFTLTLPTSEFSASGSATGTGTTVITFLYDGTDYYFNFSAYSAT